MYFSYVSRGNYVADVCLVYVAALKKTAHACPPLQNNLHHGHASIKVMKALLLWTHKEVSFKMVSQYRLQCVQYLWERAHSKLKKLANYDSVAYSSCIEAIEHILPLGYLAVKRKPFPIKKINTVQEQYGLCNVTKVQGIYCMHLCY